MINNIYFEVYNLKSNLHNIFYSLNIQKNE